MNKIKTFLTSSFLGGTVFILSIAILVAIYKWLWNHVQNALTPISNFIENYVYAPNFVINLLAILTVILIAFISGLLLKTLAKTYFDALLKKILSKIPFYKIIQDSLEQVFSPSGAKSFNRKCVAKVFSEHSYSLGYITDELPEKDMYAVYIPTAPVVSSGMIFLVKKEKVIEIDVDSSSMFRAILSCGIGTSMLVKDTDLK